MKITLIFSILLFILSLVHSQTFKAGVAKINGTLPIGTPLAGYSARKNDWWPIPNPTEYTTFMKPSIGIIDPTWCKALVISTGTEKFAFMTLDGIGSDSTLNKLAWDIATANGFTVPLENCLFSSSHSHSGPGAISPEFLWSIAPATDLMVPELQEKLAGYMAQAMVEAEKNLQDAVMGVGTEMLLGVTHNRRAWSPYVTSGTIDPHLGLIRVDDAQGNVMATIWNFAIHGTCYDAPNMKFCGDIMGRACELIEESIGGVALFINGDAGDISPAGGMCDNAPHFKGSPLMANAVVAGRAKIETSADVQLHAVSKVVPFGPTNLNVTLKRFDNCTDGGPLDICTFCRIANCDINAHLPASWIEQSPRFTALTIEIEGIKNILVSIPGEALVELGWWIRNDTLDLGYNVTLLAGYSNSHMGYFATPNEYDVGGYESQLTMWGYDTAVRIREAVKMVAEAVTPLEWIVGYDK